MRSRKRKAEEDDGDDDDGEDILPDRPCDGHRGEKGISGWWISLEDAQDKNVGKEKWFDRPNSNGVKVKAVQHVKNAPKDRPVWLFENGDMYLGHWKEIGPNGHAVEEGFGISYNNYPKDSWKGLVYIGFWKNGYPEGEGEEFWLESSQIWIENRLLDSPIYKGGRTVPFNYRGKYKAGKYHASQAVVILKDGTARIGRWKNGKPVGNWHCHGLASSSVESRRDSAPAVISGGESPGNENTENRIRQIRDWIVKDVIGEPMDPFPETVENCARELFQEDYNSINLIKKFLEEEDIQSFSWMKGPYKKIFLEWARRKRGE